MGIAGTLPKQHLKKFPHWDDWTTKESIFEGWDLVSQRFINEKCRSMPKRLRDVVASEGDMVGYSLIAVTACKCSCSKENNYY